VKSKGNILLVIIFIIVLLLIGLYFIDYIKTEKDTRKVYLPEEESSSDIIVPGEVVIE